MRLQRCRRKNHRAHGSLCSCRGDGLSDHPAGPLAGSGPAGPQATVDRPTVEEVVV